MKKILLLCFCPLVLSACSAPDPVKFPESATEQNANSAFITQPNYELPKNRFDKDEWQYRISLIGTDIEHTDNYSRIWYLAQHADRIDLTGDQNSISYLKNLFISGGSPAMIYTNSTCSDYTGYNCSNFVDMLFVKGGSSLPSQ